jgi:hypothetical protein
MRTAGNAVQPHAGPTGKRSMWSVKPRPLTVRHGKGRGDFVLDDADDPRPSREGRPDSSDETRYAVAPAEAACLFLTREVGGPTWVVTAGRRRAVAEAQGVKRRTEKRQRHRQLSLSR